MARGRAVILVSAVLAAAAAGAALLGLFRGPRGARTVVLVTVDTLRRDHVSAWGGTSAATPRMDGLAREGTRFECRTPVPLTLPAHVTMLCGLPPAVHGVRSNSASAVPPPSARAWRLVAERLAEDGRCCGAFVSAGPLVRRFGLDQGFEAYDDGDLADFTGHGYEERPGRRTVERALAWVRGLPQDAPAFLWVHLFEPHAPHPAGSYARDVEAADVAVGLLLDGLARAGRGDAAVVLASDHGEALGEEGEPTHGLLLGEGVLRVPLIVRAEGVAAGVERDDPADLADVAPLLLRLAGLPTDVAAGGAPGAGIDLLEAPAPATRPRVAESLHPHHQFRWAQMTCAVVGPRKVVEAGEGRERLHDLASPEPDAWVPAAGRAEASAAFDALRAYRRAETRRQDAGATAAGGYGAGGAVSPFLDPAENARLPDPREVVEDANRLAQVQGLLSPDRPPRPEEGLKQIGILEARDPGNPDLAFWRGRFELQARRFDRAAKAFLEALERGRLDAQTLRLAAGARAEPGHPAAGAAERAQEALRLLADWRRRVPDDPKVLDLEASLEEAAGRPEAGAAVRERAAALRRAREPAPLRPGGCR